MAYIGHLVKSIPHLVDKKADFGSKVLKKMDLKNQKKCKKKWPISGMFWCIRVTKSASPEFFRSCKVVFCSLLADQDGWEAEKS